MLTVHIGVKNGQKSQGSGGVGSPNNGLYWETPPKRGSFTVQASGISKGSITQVDVYERVGKYAI